MTRLACTFALRFVLRIRQHLLISLPEVAVERRALVVLRHPIPQKGVGRRAAVPQGIRNDLTGAPTLGEPNPAFVLTRKDVGPHFV